MATMAARLRVAEQGPPIRRSLVDFLNLVRGADPRCPERNQYFCQKTLEKAYGSGLVEKGHNGDLRRSQVTKAALSGLSGLTGGYLLPQDYSDMLLSTVAEESFIYPRATVIPMFSDEMSAPRVDVETASTVRGVSSMFGGVRFRWGIEAAAVETEPTFRMTSFKAWDLLGFAAVSNQWLQDAGAIMPTVEAERPAANPLLQAEHYLIRLFGKAAAWQAEWAFLNGTGTAQQMPLGILRSPAAFQVARAAGGAIAIADVANMTARLLPRSWSHAVWAVHPLALAQVQQLSQYFINVELAGMYKIHPKPCGVLSTLPLFVTDKLPPLGQRGDLVLFDPSLYVIAQRMEVTVDVSPDDAFTTNQTTYRVWLRLDGKPEFSNTIVLPDTTTTVSPYVVLNA